MRKITLEEIADLETELASWKRTARALEDQRRELLGWAYIGTVECLESIPSYREEARAMLDRIVRGEFGSVTL